MQQNNIVTPEVNQRARETDSPSVHVCLPESQQIYSSFWGEHVADRYILTFTYNSQAQLDQKPRSTCIESSVPIYVPLYNSSKPSTFVGEAVA